MAIVAVFYVLVLVILFWVQPSDEFDSEVVWCNEDGTNCPCADKPIAVQTNIVFILKNLGTFVFAFTAHYNLFGFYNTIAPKRKNVRSMNSIIAIALSLCGPVYVIFGIGGYFTYGNSIQGNLLSSFPLNTVSTVARMAIALIVASSYPILLFPSRVAVLHTVEQFTSEAFFKKNYNMLFYGITAVLLVVTCGTAMLVDDLGLVFNLLGGSAMTMISFVFPGMFYLKFFKDEERTSFMSHLKYYGSWGCIVFGTVFSIAVTTATFLNSPELDSTCSA